MPTGQRATRDEQALDAVVRFYQDVPHMTPDQGRRVFSHLTENNVRDVLDIGTCFGTSAAYFAAAVQANGGGRVTTVDSSRMDDASETLEWVHTGLRDSGVSDVVDVVRIPHSSYAWWLKEQVELHSDDRGGCTPQYDFAYLDGAKSLTIDGVSVIFIEQLLRPGGWLLLDDVAWTYSTNPSAAQTEGIHYPMSEPELNEPHVRAILDLIVKPSPSFTVIRREEDGQWAWAQKTAAGPTRYEVFYTSSLSDRLLRRALRIKQRLRPAASS